MQISAEDMSASWSAAGRFTPATPPPADGRFRMYEPLSDAADEYIRWAQSPGERVHTGIKKIDEEMRGIGAGELAMVIGFAHGGKTLLLMHMLEQNRDKHIALFIPDEPRQLVLTKLTCMHHKIDARELEARVARNDQIAVDLLRSTAEESFPNLAVFDQPLNEADMERGYGEISEVWGRPPELVVVDFLDLVDAGETVPDKANALKAFGRIHDVPLMVLHQTSRTSGADGRKLTMSSGAYGGEQQATMVLGVRRKKYEIASQIHELVETLSRKKDDRAEDRLAGLRYAQKVHENTLTVSLLKNKRPAGQLVDDIDFELDPLTGRLTDLHGELPRSYRQESMGWQDGKDF